MNLARGSPLTASGLPATILVAHAHATWPIAGGDRRGLVGEEDTALRIAAGERTNGTRAALQRFVQITTPPQSALMWYSGGALGAMLAGYASIAATSLQWTSLTEGG